MKILIFNFKDIKHPYGGGSELYFHEMAKEWIKKGHKVRWISGGWDGCEKKEILDGIKITRVGKKFSVYFFGPREYFKLKEKPDVIIDVENGIPFFSHVFSRKKKVLHIHHIHKEVWPREFSFPMSNIGCFLETRIMPLIYKNVKVLTLSKSSAEEILEEGCFSKKIECVPPGIEFCAYKREKKSKVPTILFLNRIKKYKRLETLLHAVKILNGQNFGLDVWVAGFGDDLERMKEYVKNNNLSNVKFFGRIDEEKKSELMQKSWVFINPSSKEGWGIVNIEANYFGTPVIGSNVGGIKDSVVDGKTGLLFKCDDEKDLAEKIKILLKDSDLRNKMSREVRDWASKFDWKTTSTRYLNFLENL